MKYCDTIEDKIAKRMARMESPAMIKLAVRSWR